MRKPIAAIFDSAGLSGARSHDLRRTFASTAADLGFGETTIAELLGHARRGVTEKFYIRRSDPILISAADRVSDFLNSALGGTLPNAKVIKLNSA
jgi:integrase